MQGRSTVIDAVSNLFVQNGLSLVTTGSPY